MGANSGVWICARFVLKEESSLLVNDTYQLIGHTPLLKVGIAAPNDVNIYAKLEMFNPGGSIKDRLGMALIEPTAGNTGIGLAIAALKYQLPVKLIVPEKFSFEKQTLMRSLSATVINTPSEQGITGAIAYAKRLAAETANSYLPLQFKNPANPAVYQRRGAGGSVGLPPELPGSYPGSRRQLAGPTGDQDPGGSNADP